MTRLSAIDMMLVDDLFEGASPGYVMDFSNKTFARFFAGELSVDIYSDVFAQDGTSKGNRLRCYLRLVEPSDAARALRVLWDYREALHARFEQKESVKDARARLFNLIRKLEGGSDSQPPTDGKPRVNTSLLSGLMAELLRITRLGPQARGFAFERFLKELFDAFGMSGRGSFRLLGEQIDGSFWLSDHPYLLEARWRNALTDAADLRAFNAKCEDKAVWTRGLFVSQAGFSEEGLAAFRGGKSIICMDGLDLADILRRGLHLQEVLLAKMRRAGETGASFVRVRDLFPE